MVGYTLFIDPWGVYSNHVQTTAIYQQIYATADSPGIFESPIKDDVFRSRGAASHSPPPVTLRDSTAEPFLVDPPAPHIPRRTPRARLASRRQVLPVRSRPGARV